MISLTGKISLWALGMLGGAFIAAANADSADSNRENTNNGDCVICSFFESMQTGQDGGSVAIAIGDSLAVSGSNIACPSGSDDQDITQTLSADPGAKSFSYATDGGVVINGESITEDPCAE